MRYREFLDNIEQYVGMVVEFTARFKANGLISKHQRYVWDKNEFCEPAADGLVEVIDVTVVDSAGRMVCGTNKRSCMGYSSGLCVSIENCMHCKPVEVKNTPFITRDLSQDERCELWGCLIDVVEDWLESRGITPEDIPNDEREGEGAAIIYGCDYDILADGFAAVLGIERDNIASEEKVI